MKRFNKRLTSIVLALALLATLFAVPVFAEEPAAVDVASYDRNAIELLNIVGITEVAQSDDLNTKVSRAEFAALLTRFVGNYNPTVADSISFKDVLPGSFGEHYITTAVASGYMQAVNEDYFYPAWEITAVDAARSLLMCLGYGDVAQNNEAFSKFTKSLKLYSDVNTESFTRGELYKMIYNALNAPVMEQTGFADDNILYEQMKDITALYRYHDIVRSEGVITGAEGVILGSGGRTELEKGLIEFDGVPFISPEFDMTSVLGREVYLYWKELGGAYDLAVHVEVMDDKSIKLKADDIISFSSNTYVYEIEEGKEKKAVLDSPYVVYNGEEYTGAYVTDIMIPDNGDVTIAENVSGSRDLVIIREFEDVLVKLVINEEDEKAIIGEELGQRYDVGTFEENVKYYDEYGLASALGDIKAGNVIAVSQSATGKRTTIYISTANVSGSLTSYDDKEWVIGEEAYPVSAALARRISMGVESVPDFNKSYNFYININGEIAFVGDGASALEDGVFYGVVTARSSGSGFASEIGIKVFSKTMGGFETYLIADKLELNGKRADSTDVIAALNKNGRDGIATNNFIAQPVKIGLNDENKVIYLMQAASDNDDGLGFFYFMGSSRQDTKGTYYQYRNVLSYSNMGGHDFAAAPKDSGYLQAGYITSTETIQIPFFAPEGDELIGAIDTSSEKAFISATRPSGSIPFIVYKEDEEDLAASFIIRAVEAGEKEHCETTVNIHCILSITEKVVDEEVVTCIKTNKMTYYLNDPKINLNALKIWDTLEKPDAVVPWVDPATGKQGVHKVVPGDIVNISADATGFIKAMEIVYDSTNKKMMGKGTGTGASYGYINSDTIWYSRNTEYNLTLLHVLKIEDGYMSATNAKDPADFIEDPDSARHYLGVVPPIICVEESGNKLTSRNAVNSDLIGYYDSPEDHATVILMHRYAQQQGTSFVIKK